MHQKHMQRWILLTLAAILIMVGLAVGSQRPDLVQTIPGFGPTATPTPIASENIIVSYPYANTHIEQQLVISGRARVAENIVMIRLSDKLSGRPYGETSVVTTATQPGEFGEFNASIGITHPELRSGQSVVLEVFQVSPEDGSETDKVTIPLTFSP